MPARIQVLAGPDKGTETTVATREVRIGRGNCNFQLHDDQINGQLRVNFEGATYRVANETELDAYWMTLDPDTGHRKLAGHLKANATAIWRDGYLLQPSANTILQLTVEHAAGPPRGADDEGDEEEVAVTRGRTPEEEKKARDRMYLLVTLLCAPVAIFLFLQPSQRGGGPPGATPAQVSQRFDKVSQDLDQDELKRHRAYGRSVVLARAHLRDARLDEVSDRPQAAYDKYRMARDELDRALGDLPSDNAKATADPADPAVPVLRAARDFIAERLVALARSLKARKR